MAEKWKLIPGFENFKINNKGEVVRIKTCSGKSVHRYIKPHYNGNYYAARLTLNKRRYSFYVHTLVCLLFVGEKPSSVHEVNHKDGVKTNNFYKNLEWMTKQENARHRFDVLGHRSSNLGKKFTREWRNKVIKTLKNYQSINDKV